MSTRDLDSPPQPASELPPFVFVPEDGGSTERSEPPIASRAATRGRPGTPALEHRAHGGRRRGGRRCARLRRSRLGGP